MAAEVAEQQKRRMLLQLQGIVSGRMDEAGIESVERVLLSMHTPVLVGSAQGVYVTEKKKLSSLYNTLYQLGYPEPKQMPIFDFFQALDDMKKRK